MVPHGFSCPRCTPPSTASPALHGESPQATSGPGSPEPTFETWLSDLGKPHPWALVFPWCNLRIALSACKGCSPRGPRAGGGSGAGRAPPAPAVPAGPTTTSWRPSAASPWSTTWRAPWTSKAPAPAARGRPPPCLLRSPLPGSGRRVREAREAPGALDTWPPAAWTACCSVGSSTRTTWWWWTRRAP